MKTALWIASGLAVAWLAYSLGPDMRRYWKIHSM